MTWIRITLSYCHRGMALDLACVYSRGVMATLRRFNLALYLAGVFIALVPCARGQTTPSTPPPLVYQREDVLELMKRVMNFQIKAYDNKTPITWQAGAFWAGVTGAYDTTKDPAFHDAAKRLGADIPWPPQYLRRTVWGLSAGGRNTCP